MSNNWYCLVCNNSTLPKICMKSKVAFLNFEIPATLLAVCASLSKKNNKSDSFDRINLSQLLAPICIKGIAIFTTRW